MGIGEFFRSIFRAGTPEGARDAMRRAYRTSMKKSRQGEDVPISESDMPDGITGPPAHTYALFEMLASRYAASGVSRKQIQQRASSLWVELSPFLYLDREDAVEALAEYVLWKEATDEFPEMVSEVRLDWLKAKVRRGVSRAEEIDPSGWVAGAKQSARELGPGESSWIRWVEFL